MADQADWQLAVEKSKTRIALTVHKYFVDSDGSERLFEGRTTERGFEDSRFYINIDYADGTKESIYLDQPEQLCKVWIFRRFAEAPTCRNTCHLLLQSKKNNAKRLMPLCPRARPRVLPRGVGPRARPPTFRPTTCAPPSTRLIHDREK